MSRSLIIWYAVLLHVIWGVTLMFFPVVGQTTPPHAIVSLAGNTMIAGIILLIAGLLALLAMLTMGPTFTRLLVLLPQQFLLIIGAVGAIGLVLQGHYADGVIRPKSFMFVDQLPAILAAFLHTIAVAESHWGVGWRRR